MWIAKFMGHKVTKTVHALYFKTYLEKEVAAFRSDIESQVKALKEDQSGIKVLLSTEEEVMSF